MNEIALVLFVGIELAGVIIAIAWLRDARHPIPRAYPGGIFRLVRREDRAAYVRIMHRTQAVAFRDLGRSFDKFGREIGRQLLPALDRFAAIVRGLGR